MSYHTESVRLTPTEYMILFTVVDTMVNENLLTTNMRELLLLREKLLQQVELEKQYGEKFN